MTIPKYDFHIHYKAHARDATGNEEAMVQRAVEVGLSGICFTEHSQQLPPERIRDLRSRYPIKIWSGMEVATAEGNDVLVFGHAPHMPARPTWQWLFGYCEARGLMNCLAHPFRKDRGIPEAFAEYRPDFIEAVSRNTPTWAAPLLLARFPDAHFLVNSDSHKPKHLGWHFNYRNKTAEDLAELLDRQQVA